MFPIDPDPIQGVVDDEDEDGTTPIDGVHNGQRHVELSDADDNRKDGRTGVAFGDINQFLWVLEGGDLVVLPADEIADD